MSQTVLETQSDFTLHNQKTTDFSDLIHDAKFTFGAAHIKPKVKLSQMRSEELSKMFIVSSKVQPDKRGSDKELLSYHIQKHRKISSNLKSITTHLQKHQTKGRRTGIMKSFVERNTSDEEEEKSVTDSSNSDDRKVG